MILARKSVKTVVFLEQFCVSSQDQLFRLERPSGAAKRDEVNVMRRVLATTAPASVILIRLHCARNIGLQRIRNSHLRLNISFNFSSCLALIVV